MSYFKHSAFLPWSAAMVGIIWIVGVSSIVYSVYRQSKIHGRWYWHGFLGVLGAMAIFVAGIIIPGIHWATTHDAIVRSHVGLFASALLGSIFIFVAGMIYALRKWSMARVAEGADPTVPASPAAVSPEPKSGFDQSSR